MLWRTKEAANDHPELAESWQELQRDHCLVLQPMTVWSVIHLCGFDCQLKVECQTVALHWPCFWALLQLLGLADYDELLELQY